jgi:hypothetical protein
VEKGQNDLLPKGGKWKLVKMTSFQKAESGSGQNDQKQRARHTRLLLVKMTRSKVGRQVKRVTNPEGKNQHGEVDGQNDQQPRRPRTTAEQIAKDAGVSEHTVRRAAKAVEQWEKVTGVDAGGLFFFANEEGPASVR